MSETQSQKQPVRESFAQTYKLRKIAGKFHCTACRATVESLPHVCKEWGAR